MDIDQAALNKLPIYTEPLCRPLTNVEVISDTPIINGVISKANNDVMLWDEPMLRSDTNT